MIDGHPTQDVGAFEFPTPPARETLELALEAPGLRNSRGIFSLKMAMSMGKNWKNDDESWENWGFKI
jgi:hypothetical protein